MRKSHIIYTAIGSLILITVLLSFITFPPWTTPRSVLNEETTQLAPSETLPTIEVTLFYISENGMQLVGIERQIPYGGSTTEQARQITENQLTIAPEPLGSPIPEGTKLRAIFVTERGDVFVDLSHEVQDAHSGGSLEELFTVYAIVNALTANLPDITAVQILVEGREVDTLVGHVDLRQPLEQNLTWVEGSPDITTTNSGA